MIAAPNPRPVELMLEGSSQYDRRLSLHYSERFGVTIAMYPRGPADKSLVMLAWTSAPWSRVRLQMEQPDDCSLWVGNTAFDVNQEEVAKLRSTYGPYGLNIFIDKDYVGDSST